MDFVEDEIAHYDFTTCPYSTAHRLHSPDKFRFHITRCKERQKAGIAARIRQCTHNVLHIFTDHAALEYHLPRCPNHPNRPEYQQFLQCPFNKNHECQDIDKHSETCPNREYQWTPTPAPSQDITAKGRMNAAHGLVSLQDSFAAPVKQQKMSVAFKTTISFLGAEFDVFQKNAVRGKPPELIQVSYLTKQDYRVWPGLSEARGQLDRYLACTFVPGGTSKRLFEYFVERLKSDPQEPIAVSYQDCLNEDVVYFITTPAELQGLGKYLQEDTLGLFTIPHSMLTDRASILGELKAQRTTKIHLQGVIRDETNQINEIQESKEKLKTHYVTEQEKAKKTEDQRAETQRRIFEELKPQIDQLQATFLKEKESKEREYLKIDEQDELNQLVRADETKILRETYKEQLETKDQTIDTLKRDLETLEKQLKLAETCRQTERPPAEPERVDEQLSEECMICHTEKKNCMQFPCGHLVCCSACMTSLKVSFDTKVPRNNQLYFCRICTTPVKRMFKCFPY